MDDIAHLRQTWAVEAGAGGNQADRSGCLKMRPRCPQEHPEPLTRLLPLLHCLHAAQVHVPGGYENKPTVRQASGWWNWALAER